MNSLQASSPNQITFLADTNTHRFRFDIPSSDGTKAYRVAQAQTSGQWQCSCPAWIYQKGPMAQRKPCKHLKAMNDLLLQIEGKAAAPAAVAAAPRVLTSGADAAREALEALVRSAEAEVAATERQIADAEKRLDAAKAKLAALRVAAKAAA